MKAVLTVVEDREATQYSVSSIGRSGTRASRSPLKISSRRGSHFCAMTHGAEAQSKYARIRPSEIAPSMLAVAVELGRAVIFPATICITIGALIAFTALPSLFGDEGYSVESEVNFAVAEDDALSEPTLKPAVEAEQQGLTPAQIAEQQSLIQFIAGMIAINQPSMHDVGKLSREIVEISAERNVDPFFVAAIISVESRFHQNARSSVGATGLMQLMPATARILEREKGMSARKLTDIRHNINLGVEYIVSMEKRYNGNRFLALAAYNWGPGNVDRVNRGVSTIPGSVRRYASTVVERSINWSRHYRKAKESALGVDQLAAREESKTTL